MRLLISLSTSKGNPTQARLYEDTNDRVMSMAGSASAAFVLLSAMCTLLYKCISIQSVNRPPNFWELKYMLGRPCLTCTLILLTLGWNILTICSLWENMGVCHRREIPEPAPFLFRRGAQIGVCRFFSIVKITMIHQVRMSPASTAVWAWR